MGARLKPLPPNKNHQKSSKIPPAFRCQEKKTHRSFPLSEGHFFLSPQNLERIRGINGVKGYVGMLRNPYVFAVPACLMMRPT